MPDEDRCEECWWGYGNGGSCAHPHWMHLLDNEIPKPCGYFEPKVKPVEKDEYEEFQNEWN